MLGSFVSFAVFLVYPFVMAVRIRGEEELLAPGGDGIHGVRLANAIQLSSWIGQEVSISDFPEDTYLSELNQRIAAEGLYEQRS